ncbi:hypothetical protein CPI83_30390 (plasmid) [Rhodococcus sp. H-CA8f]|uniref:hypothetical protein n=1 Tax=Mycobacteriales TaxID=85007 RepID=UPI000BE30730|nr:MULTISPECIES: hypothetical protein [unclassified Rhodococcus (in: high G+C Gram-positive bacteria)]ATI36504.1 hypothetical protein CPI83_30390 [Rhodococcus sp. H-CA8f]
MSRLQAALLALALPVLCACGTTAPISGDDHTSDTGTPTTSSAAEHIPGAASVPDVPDPAPSLAGTPQLRDYLAALIAADIATDPADLNAIADYTPKMCMMKRLTNASDEETTSHAVDDLSALGISLDAHQADVLVSAANDYICPKPPR